jgi:hypothetical protein
MSWRGRGVDYVCTRRSHSRQQPRYGGYLGVSGGDGGGWMREEIPTCAHCAWGLRWRHGRRRLCYRAIKGSKQVFGGLGHSVAVPSGEYGAP